MVLQIKKSKQFRTGINIVRAKKHFKIFFLFALVVSLILGVAAFNFYEESILLTGCLIGIITILFIISHLLYVRSRDKMEIIDYFSLKYYLYGSSFKTKVVRFWRYLKVHVKSFIMIVIILCLLQITWIFTLTQLTDYVSFSAIGFFVAVEKMPYELKFLAYQRNAVLDSIRSDEAIIKYTLRLRKLGWNTKNRPVYDYLMDEIEKEQRIQKHHNQLLMKTTVVYNISSYLLFLIFIEITGILSWSQWLKLVM